MTYHCETRFWRKLFLFNCFCLVFQNKGVDINRPVVSMCNSGMSSCSLVLAAKWAGAQNAALYHVSQNNH